MSQTQTKKIKILIAEDNRINQLLFKAIFDSESIETVFATNGREAFSLYSSKDFDLLLMDIEMPVMNGIEATKKIRNKEKANGKHLPIIAVTGYAMEEQIKEIMNSGIDDYLTKPFNKTKLMSKLSKYVTL